MTKPKRTLGNARPTQSGAGRARAAGRPGPGTAREGAATAVDAVHKPLAGPIDESAIADGLGRLGLSPSAEQRDQLIDYLRLLQRWTGVYNLTAVRDGGDMVTHHLLDCLTVLPRLAAWLDRPATAAVPGSEAPHPPGPQPQILDVGSGGGLPGVVLAICRPDWMVTCVDTVAKKAGFIRQVAAELRLPNLGAEHARVETLAQRGPRRYQVVTARAFASLPDLVRLTQPLLAEDGVWMAMKGQVPEDEIRALPPEVEVFHVEQLEVPGLDARRCLVWIRPRTTAR